MALMWPLPMGPMPMVATLTRLLGACAPRAEAGIISGAATADAAAVFRNDRRDTFIIILPKYS